VSLGAWVAEVARDSTPIALALALVICCLYLHIFLHLAVEVGQKILAEVALLVAMDLVGV
jgi:hypothetical protein